MKICAGYGFCGYESSDQPTAAAAQPHAPGQAGQRPVWGQSQWTELQLLGRVQQDTEWTSGIVNIAVKIKKFLFE